MDDGSFWFRRKNKGNSEMCLALSLCFLVLHLQWLYLLIISCKLAQNMKKEHAQLAHDAHECADSIPDLSKMVSGVQMLGMF